MRLLIDTHCWLWWFLAPEKLNNIAKEAMAVSTSVLFFSAVSSWEIAIKHRLGKLKLPEPPVTYIPKKLEKHGMTPLPMHHRHALGTTELPLHHRDPFDRLLISQARTDNLQLVSADPQLRQYDVDILWAAH